MKHLFIISLILITSACRNRVNNSGEIIGTNLPIIGCIENDNQAPTLNGAVNFNNEATINKSPEISFNTASDNCEISHYEVSIGHTIDGTEIANRINIGNQTTWTIENIDLNYADVYYVSVAAVDTAGNTSSTIVSSSFQVFTPKTLTSLVLWLDAHRLDSISDNENDGADSSNFSGDVKKWLDISGSSKNHHFQQEASNFPQFNVTNRSVSFSGNEDLMATADHSDINLGLINQRNLTAVFKTSDNTTSRQVIYEEGGTIRGINIYLENNQVHCGFWNVINDGDGKQGYIEVSGPVMSHSFYVVSLVFDYSHFIDANSANGTVECFVNESSVGVVETSSRLHPHSGDIGLGGMNNGSFFPDGSNSGSRGFYFDGDFYELLLYNKAHNVSEIQKLHQLLIKKWESS